MISYLLAALLPVAYAAGSATLAGCLACLVSVRARRVTVALMRFARRYAPRWLVPALVVCAFIPGPIDEGLIIVASQPRHIQSLHARRIYQSVIQCSGERGEDSDIHTTTNAGRDGSGRPDFGRDSPGSWHFVASHRAGKSVHSQSG